MSSEYARDELRASPPAWQTIVSLLLFAHLFFVAVALGSNHLRSGLANQLLSRFAFYTRFLHFDLNFVPYHLTHGTDTDVDHRIEVLPRDRQDWLVLPDGGFRGQDGYQRLQRYAREWAVQAADDGQPALFARSVGNYFSQELKLAPQQVRCRKHFQLSRDDLASDAANLQDPDAPGRFSVPYAANAIVNADGTVDVVRVDEAGQVAAPVTPRTSDGSSSGSQRP